MPFKFENLLVWQRAIDFTDLVYDASAKFPKDELFNITSQFKRATTSISLNIAEGASGNSNPEFQRFLTYAGRSVAEVVNCLYICRRRKFISEEQFKLLYSKAEELAKMISGLSNSLK